MEHPATQSSDSPHGTPVEGSTAFKEAVARGYEPHDIGLRPIFMFIAGLSVTLVVVLAAIYAIMMAIAAHDRSGEPIRSPLAAKVAEELPPVYAPLQPSLGAYGNHKNDHDVFDWQDMDAMRYRTQEALNNEGTVGNRHYVPISKAIDTVLAENMLVVKPVALSASVEIPPPAGSYEGVYKAQPPEPTIHYNDMNRLNDLGN